MSKKLFSEKLNMTLEEMEKEIIMMRRLEQYMIDALGMEQYDFLVRGFARKMGEEKLKELGASEEEAQMIIDSSEEETGYSTEKQ